MGTIYTVQGPDGTQYDLHGPDNATAEQLGDAVQEMIRQKQGQNSSPVTGGNHSTTYTMTGPDGRDYSIDGPPGATQAQVAAQMQQHFATQGQQRIVAMPDGTHVSFPADMPPDQIRSLIAQKFPNDPYVKGAQPHQQGKDVGTGGALGHGLLDAATFGLFDKAAPYVGAALTHVTPGPDLTVDQSRQVMQANEGVTDAAHPYAHATGEVGGMVAGGAGLERGALAIAGKLAPRGAQAVRAALALKEGQSAANVARMAGHGAISGGLYGGVSGAVQGAQADGLRGALTEGTEDAALGAGAGAVVGPAATGIAKVVGGAGRLLQGPAAAALRIVASKSRLPGETFDDAAQRVANDAQEFQARFGRYPAPAELMQVSQAKEIGDTIRRTTSAQQFCTAGRTRGHRTAERAFRRAERNTARPGAGRC